MSAAASSAIFSRPDGEPEQAAVDVVYSLSFTTWQAAWRRGLFMPEDRLVQSLIDSPRVSRLLVCNHARSLPLKLLRDLTGTDRAPRPGGPGTRLVQPMRLRRRERTTIQGAERDFAAYDRAIARAARRHGMRDPIVITAHPLVAGFADLSWSRAVTFYAIDDWAAHPSFSQWWSLYRESYERLRASRRRVVAVSSVLLERIAPTGPAAVVANGLDPAEWTGEVATPAWLAEVSRPLLVYAGRLDHRIDIEWLRTLALQYPSATIALLGSVEDPARFEPLRSLRNVRFTGMLPRAAVTGVLRSADAGLLPHLRTPLTSAMSPLKLYEYLAAGLPVAATDLPPVRQVPHPHVVLVPDGGDYAAAVGEALRRGRASERERIEFVERNSWRSRHEQLLELAAA
jgi:glycosyltransferase involved in cell wall biosynthesis